MGVKISALTPVSSLSGAEVFPVVQSGTTKKATISDIGTILGSGYILVASALVSGSPATTISFTGLDLDSAGRYVIYAGLKNNTGSDTYVGIEFNGDSTTTNYSYCYFVGYQGGATAGSANTCPVFSLYASTSEIGFAHIFKDSESYTRTLINEFCGNSTSAAQLGTRDGRWNNTANVTSIQLRSPVASALAVGSWAKIYRLAA